MESTLTLVWVTLQDIPWNYHDWPSLERILDPIGTIIALDKATLTRTIPTTAKTQIEIDLTRTKLNKIEVALLDNSREIQNFLHLRNMNKCRNFIFIY